MMTINSIKKMIGSMDKFINTDCIVQNDNNGIINMRKENRREFIKKIFDVSDTTERYKNIRREMKEKMKEKEIIEVKNNISEMNMKICRGEEEMKKVNREIEKVNRERKKKQKEMDNICVDETLIKEKIENIRRMIIRMEKENEKLEKEKGLKEEKSKKYIFEEAFEENHKNWEIEKIRRIMEIGYEIDKYRKENSGYIEMKEKIERMGKEIMEIGKG